MALQVFTCAGFLERLRRQKQTSAPPGGVGIVAKHVERSALIFAGSVVSNILLHSACLVSVSIGLVKQSHKLILAELAAELKIIKAKT
ncbi:MAG: hypothetical protein ABW157_07850 [Candidatus Thiodiazotropha sp. LLP2]